MTTAIISAWIVVLGATAVLASTNGDVRVTGDHVNLRARPLADAEVVAQAGEGEVLTAVRQDGEWTAVLAPTNASVWVNGAFVRSNVVVSDKLNLRGGPSLSYRDVGALRKGDRVAVVETKGEWLRIVAPTGVELWVSSRYVASEGAVASNAVSPVPATAVSAMTAAAAPVPAQTVQPTSTFPRELPADISVEKLAPVLGQGAVIERRGRLTRVPMAALRGVEYCLVDAREGQQAMVCYLRGIEGEAEAAMGQQMTVKGRGYWLNGERIPLIYPDRMIPGGMAHE